MQIQSLVLAGEELNKQFASALILFYYVYSSLYYMLSDEINMFKLKLSANVLQITVITTKLSFNTLTWF